MKFRPLRKKHTTLNSVYSLNGNIYYKTISSEKLVCVNDCSEVNKLEPSLLNAINTSFRVQFPTYNIRDDAINDFPSMFCAISDIDEFNIHAKRIKTPNFSIILINIRSTRGNFANFEIFLSSLVVQFDIIVVTETWLTAEISSIFHMSGYQCINLFRNRHGGGNSGFRSC